MEPKGPFPRMHLTIVSNTPQSETKSFSQAHSFTYKSAIGC